MAKGARQKMKLLYLMKILMERTEEEHFMTISQMVEALAELGIGAERKSLYDDLEALRAFGLDVESRRGKNFGYYIASRTFEPVSYTHLLKCCEEQFAQNRALLGPGFWEREKEGGKLPGKRRKKGLRMRNPFLLLLANIGDANFSIIWMHSNPGISGL